MQIYYVAIDEKIRDEIGEKLGKTVKDHIHLDGGSFAAFDGKEIVGFISAYEKELGQTFWQKDAYIDIIEVKSTHKRRGIGRELVARCEKWAKDSGLTQIRAWSSDDKFEAIQMWHKLGFGMCPAVMRGESTVKEFVGKPVYGFYVVKVLV